MFDINRLLHVASVRRKKLWRSTVEKAFPNFTAHSEKAYATRETEVNLAAKPICEGRTGPLAESVSVAMGHLWFHERYRASPCDNVERPRRVSGADPQQQNAGWGCARGLVLSRGRESGLSVTDNGTEGSNVPCGQRLPVFR